MICSLTSTLLSRLVLNLRGAGIRKDSDETGLSTRLSIAPHEDAIRVPPSTFGMSMASQSTSYTDSSIVERSDAWGINVLQEIFVSGDSQEDHI